MRKHLGLALVLVSACDAPAPQAPSVSIAVSATPSAVALQPSNKRFCDYIAWKATGPICLGEVPAEAVPQRERTFELTMDGDKVVRYRIINGWGGPGDDQESSDGQIAYEGDQIHEVVLSTWGGKRTGRWLYEYGGTRQRLVDDNGQPAVRRADWAQVVEVEYDEHGFAKRERKLDALGNPRPTDGYIETRSVHDERGRLIEVAYFDEQGEPALTSKGVARTVYEYPHGDRAEVSRYFGRDGKPIPPSVGCASYRYDFGPDGNARRAHCQDPSGKELSVTTIVRDSHGLGIEYRVEGPNGKPMVGFEGFATAHARYDGAGRMVSTDKVDVDGALMPGERMKQYRWDSRSRLVEMASFDTVQRGARPAEIERYEYDGRDHAVRLRWVDPDGRPTKGPQGYAVLVTVFDDRERIVEQSFADENGEPTADPSGFARVTFEFAANGIDKKETRWFDAQGRQVDPIGARWIVVKWGDVPAVGKRRAVKNRSRDEARRKAEEALSRLRQHEAFEAVAKALSDDPAVTRNGGDLGEIHLGSHADEIDRALMNAEPGGLTDIIESADGFYVLERKR
ncbi:MAG TPA: peptidylprolyl isomerase [Polyangiaceae bacterium]|nr:peptidylprolyl isomerase [Polyangiaceae bacterium]